MLRIA